jgi:hypothetical protein
MTNPSYDSGSAQNRTDARHPAGWLKVAAVAAASALAGGLAAAWWHRKTLDKLQQSGDRDRNPEFRISEPDTHDDV